MYRRALLIALLAVVVLAESGGAVPTVNAEPSSALTARPDAVVVIKHYGAAMRLAPSSDADIGYTASCGDLLTVTGERDGWYQVYARAASYWVGGARVADVRALPDFDCRGAVTFQVGDVVETFVLSGCLSLRHTPSRGAAYDFCVNNGHRYYIANGPIEVNGEDWFELWSPSTDSGWSLAEFLYPVQ